MRAAIYARYSSDLQSAASIEDQVRACRVRLEREQWELVATFTDHAISGATRFRPGYEALLEASRKGAIDIVLAEALDRLSRDQEHIAGLYKQLTFAGVKIVTLSEGEINELHVGLKGTMNALFLKDLAQKIRRGLEGRVRDGHSGGGLGYGYEVVRVLDSRGEPVRGQLSINEAKAAIIRRIFEEYARGRSPRAIAVGLNADRVAGPSGKLWGPSAIYGNWRRGTGVLNNELYVGRRVWNRQKFLKDPATGKRVTRYNSTDQLITQAVPELRIVSDAIWSAAKERQLAIRSAVTVDKKGIRSERARRPAYLLSGLIRCGICGGGFSKRSETHYACSTAHDRGTCTNLLRIRRDVLEASVLSGLRTHLMKPELVREFVAEYQRELNRLGNQASLERDRQTEDLTRIDRQIRAIIEAIKDGLRTPSMQAELLALEAQKRATRASLAESLPTLVRLHPNLDKAYRERIARLHQELNDEAARAEAAEILRSLIKEIRLIPERGQLEIELIGDLASILLFASGKPPSIGESATRITVVAGEGLEPPTLGL